MTSLLDRPITAASDDGVCRWHAAKLWQTRAKLLKLNLICIVSCATSKKRTKIWTIDLKKIKLEFGWKEDSSFPIGWSLRFLRCLRSLRCVGWNAREVGAAKSPGLVLLTAPGTARLGWALIDSDMP